MTAGREGRVAVTMPQLGETVAEGTVLRWLKRVGDHVADQEPLLEIATDKVDTEVPSPAGGVLDEIVIGEDETVDVGTVLAHLLPVGSGAEQPESPPVADPPVVRAAEHEPSLPPADPHVTDPPPRAASRTGPRHRHSPRVRRLAHETGVDLFSITGTGPGGRVTPQDVTRATTPDVVADPRTSSRVVAEAGSARMFRTIVVDVDLPLQHRTASLDTASAGAATTGGQRLPAFVAPSVIAVVGALRGQPALLAPGAHGGGVDVAVSWTTESGSHSRLIANAHELNAGGVGQRVHEPAAPNADLARAHFLLSFLLDDDVLLEVGEPPPGHAATVTFGAPTQRVVVVEADGSPSIGIRLRAYVSVSYDPNALGREVAVSFLRDLARRVASLT